jgi:hypothetical protein
MALLAREDNPAALVFHAGTVCLKALVEER